jgi:hypothetical protein
MKIIIFLNQSKTYGECIDKVNILIIELYGKMKLRYSGAFYSAISKYNVSNI